MKKRTSRSTSGPRRTSSRSGTSGRTAGTGGAEAAEDAKYKDSPFAYVLEAIRKIDARGIPRVAHQGGDHRPQRGAHADVQAVIRVEPEASHALVTHRDRPRAYRDTPAP